MEASVDVWIGWHGSLKKTSQLHIADDDEDVFTPHWVTDLENLLAATFH